MPIPSYQQPVLDAGSGSFTLPWWHFLIALLAWTPVPAAANAPGKQGQMAYDSGFLYVCVAKNSWVRTALAAW